MARWVRTWAERDGVGTIGSTTAYRAPKSGRTRTSASGAGDDDLPLHPVRMRDGGRAQLCDDCTEVELDRGNVAPDDPRLA